MCAAVVEAKIYLLQLQFRDPAGQNSMQMGIGLVKSKGVDKEW